MGFPWFCKAKTPTALGSASLKQYAPNTDLCRLHSARCLLQYERFLKDKFRARV